MATERADSNYHNAGGATQGPGNLTLGDIEHASHEPKQDATNISGATPQSDTVDEKLRSGIYSQNDAVAENRSGADGFNVRFDQDSLKFDKSDPSQLANVMREFGDLEIVDLGMSDSRAVAVLSGKTEVTEPTGAVAADSQLDQRGDDDESDEGYSYNGDRDTQEAFARLGTIVSRDSQIPDQLLQTLDRLNRQSSRSA